MLCPRHKTKLKKVGISLVCSRCDYKVLQPDKNWVPEVRHTVYFPREYAWSSFTNTGITVSGNTASLTSGETEGTMISPQFTNLTRSTEQLREFSKVKIDSISAENNEGRMRDIDDVEDAERQRHARGDGGIEAADQYAGDDGVDKKIERKNHC